MTVVEIGTAEELVAFAARVNAGETTLDARLTADIDMTGVAWTPIGSDYTKSYAGVFDGSGHTISNLEGEWGLIWAVSGASVFNLRFADCNIIIDNTYDNWNIHKITPTNTVAANGLLIGINLNIESDTIISNIYITNCQINTLYNDRTETALIIGYTRGHDKISNVFVSGCTISTANDQASAIVGYPDIKEGGGTAQETMTNCLLYDVSLSSPAQVGGVSGGGNSAPAGSTTTITDCAIIKSSYDYARYHGRINAYGNGVYPNRNYVSDNTVTGWVPVSSITSNDGQTISTSLMHQKGFYDGTGIDGTVYLNWDFEHTWYWDSTDNLPKLQVFRRGLPFRVKTTAGIKRTVKGFCKTTGGWKQATAAKTKTNEGWK